MTQQPPSMCLERVKPPVESRDLECDTRTDQAKSLIAQRVVANADGDVPSDLCLPSETVFCGLLVQRDTQSRSDISQERYEEILQLPRASDT
jgi:hypothetical protein